MTRRLAPLALIAAFAAGLGACGGTTDEDYAESYRPVNTKIVDIGTEVGEATRQVRRRSAEQVEKRFGQLAQQTGEVQQRVDELEPPDDLKDEQDELVAALGDAQGALEDIEKGFGDRDRSAIRAGFRELASASARIRRARQPIAEETGSR